MCHYRCLLCGHAYEIEPVVKGSADDDASVPDWSASDNSCPVCGGLALPWQEAYQGALVPRGRYDVVRVETAQ